VHDSSLNGEHVRAAAERLSFRTVMNCIQHCFVVSAILVLQINVIALLLTYLLIVLVYTLRAVPTILDLTVGFTPDSAEPTLLNVILGRPCRAEMYVRSV